MDVMMSDGVTCVCLCQRVLRCSRLNGSSWIYLHVGGSTIGRVPLSSITSLPIDLSLSLSPMKPLYVFHNRDTLPRAHTPRTDAIQDDYSISTYRRTIHHVAETTLRLSDLVSVIVFTSSCD